MNINTVIDAVVERDPTIVSVVGAGISKASGMPTFRGEDGLWNNYRAEELATPSAFSKDPKLVWEWYRARMRILLEAEPNPAHYSLTKLEEENISIGIITQNVDGLHEIAGSKKIVEIHGRIRYARCVNCDNIERWDSSTKAQKDIALPYCHKCEINLLRPDVVWFGEPLDPQSWQQAAELTMQSNVMLVIGTSGVVVPVSTLPIYAKQNNSIVIEFNIEQTPISGYCDYSLLGPCEETLPEFTEILLEKMK